jgi:hypothetical protein
MHKPIKISINLHGNKNIELQHSGTHLLIIHHSLDLKSTLILSLWWQQSAVALL